MNENNELLLYIYENASMGVKSTTTLIRTINNKDNKIKKILEGELKGYENFVKDIEKLLKKYKSSGRIFNWNGNFIIMILHIVYNFTAFRIW